MILSAYLSPKERPEDSDERFSGGLTSAKLVGFGIICYEFSGVGTTLLSSCLKDPADNSQCDNSEIKISARWLRRNGVLGHFR